MKVYFTELAHQQWIDDETLEWSCDCKHGSIGRIRKGRNKPCIHTFNALYKLSKAKISERIKERLD